MIEDLEREMKKAAEALDFERAAGLRDRVLGLKDLQLGVRRIGAGAGQKGFLGSGANLAMADAIGRAKAPRRAASPRRRRR
jgi:hypothetical protein